MKGYTQIKKKFINEMSDTTRIIKTLIQNREIEMKLLVQIQERVGGPDHPHEHLGSVIGSV